MRTARKEDLNHITDLLVRAYHENPTVLRVVGQHPGAAQRMEALFRVSIADMIKIKGVHLTDNGNGVAVLYPVELKPKSVSSQLQILLKATGLRRGLQAMKRERLIREIRPKGDYLHFWMLAVDPEKNGTETIIEMRDFAFRWSDRIGKPIYAETPMRRTKIIYERYGFEAYHQWSDGDYSVWFLKRPSQKDA